MPPNCRALLLSPLLLSLLSTCAAAQQATTAGTSASAPEGPIQQVDVKARAGSYDARRDDTATKIVVTQAEILQFGDTALGDVLKRLPGITIGGVPGRGGEIRMRGLGNGYTQILLNGEPSPPGFSLDALSPDMVERIEILRAATAEHSTQAIAGTINVVLKRAIVTAQRELKPGVRMDNGAPGSNMTFQLSDRAGIYSYAVGGGLNYSKQRRADRGFTTLTDPDGAAAIRRDTASANRGLYRALNLAPRVNINLGPDDVVTSQTFLNATRYAGPWQTRTITSFGAPPPYASLDGDVDEATDAARTDLSWAHKMAGGGKLDLKGGVNYTRRANDQASHNRNAGGAQVLERAIDAGSSERGWTASAKYTAQLWENHTFSSGVDGASSGRDESRLQQEYAPVGAATSNLDQSWNAVVSRVALFAQDDWTINAQWSGYLGVRWEGIRLRSTVSTAPVAITTSVWSPLFQLLYKLPGSKNDQVRLALTRTYKAPNFAMLIPRRLLADNNSATTPDIQGNPLLKPELATGVDLAFEHYLAGGGLLSASGYLRHITDNTRNKIFLIDGAWVSMPVNTGPARAHGIELEAKFPLRSVIGHAQAIDVRANLARNWSTLDSVQGPNNRLVSQTPFSATFGIDYKADKWPVTAGASYSFQNGGPVRFSENEFDYAGPKRVLDLYALVKFSPKHQLRLSVANALHQDTIIATTWINRSGALSDAVFTPTSTVFRAAWEIKL